MLYPQLQGKVTTLLHVQVHTHARKSVMKKCDLDYHCFSIILLYCLVNPELIAEGDKKLTRFSNALLAIRNRLGQV